LKTGVRRRIILWLVVVWPTTMAQNVAMSQTSELTGDQILRLSDADFARWTVNLFNSKSEADRAMAAVGYQNLYVDLNAFRAFARVEGKKKLDLDDLFRINYNDMLEGRKLSNAERRSGWYVMGAAAIRLQEKATGNSAIQQASNDVCLAMAESGRLLKYLLANDREWQPQEKSWFLENIGDEPGGVSYVINKLTPDSCKYDPRLKSLADRYNVTIRDFGALPDASTSGVFRFALNALVLFSQMKARFNEAIRTRERSP
jgi:hypothetical protein